MPSFWETARKILSGKPKGSKLIVLGVFMESLAAGLWIYSPGNFVIGAVVVLGVFAFVRGLNLYEAEAHATLQKNSS